MEKLGLSKAESAKGSEASAAPHEDAVELASSHPADAELRATSRVTPQDAQADDSVQPELADEDKDEEKEDAA